MKNVYPSVLEYYNDRAFNPVPITLVNDSQWEDQITKRVNLLQNHLGVPVSLLKDKEILEIGCNSGENALVLAHFGAQLTLSEPNEQVHPRLVDNFNSFSLKNQLKEVYSHRIEELTLDKKYDLVIAEGFLNTLPKRNELLQNLFNFCKDDGLLIINYDDRYGGYFELIKSYILKHICNIKHINFRGKDSLELAYILYKESFSNLNASRPFEAWWEDQLVNPFATCIWSLKEILQISEKSNFEFYSSSPMLPNPNLFKWYKDVNDSTSINKKIIDSWYESFVYILTGRNEEMKEYIPANNKLIRALEKHTSEIVNFISMDNLTNNTLDYPVELKTFLTKHISSSMHVLSDELESLYEVLNGNSPRKIISEYKSSKILKNTWGTLLHYICLRKKH